MTSVRAAHPDDRPAIDEILTASWGEPRAAANGRVYELLTLPAMVAVSAGGMIVGVVTFEIVGDEVEIISIDATDRLRASAPRSSTPPPPSASRTACARCG